MANQIKFEILGIKEVQKMLADIPKEFSDKIQFDLNKAAGKIVEKELQQSVPVGNNDKSSKNKAENNTLVTKSDSKSGVYVGFNKRAWYVKLIERGTKVRQTKGRGKYKKKANRGTVNRKPFIEAAYDRAAPKAVKYLSDNYLKLLNKAIRKQVRKVINATKKR